MVIECPTCKNPLRVKKADTEFICYKCGSVMTGYNLIRLGVATYKFKDDDKEYILVFTDEDELKDFVDIVYSHIKEYRHCKIKYPTYVDIIV